MRHLSATFVRAAQRVTLLSVVCWHSNQTSNQALTKLKPWFRLWSAFIHHCLDFKLTPIVKRAALNKPLNKTLLRRLIRRWIGRFKSDEDLSHSQFKRAQELIALEVELNGELSNELNLMIERWSKHLVWGRRRDRSKRVRSWSNLISEHEKWTWRANTKDTEHDTEQTDKQKIE